jgi:hypothetical protein
MSQTSNNDAPFAALVAVGPDEQELARTADLLASIAAYEPARPFWFVMVDDAAGRDLCGAFAFPPNCTPASVPHPRQLEPQRAARARKGKGLCAAIRQGLRWIADNASAARFTLKLDTDALVVAPFAEKIEHVFVAHPDVGMIGAYDRTPNGEPRDISNNAANIEGLYRGDGLLRKLKTRFGSDEQATISRHIGEALKHGYRFGEHCLGGAYAISAELPRRMREGGYLDDPGLWLPIDCPEDVMVGLYTKCVALRHMNCVGDGEVFGVRHRGLADTPQRLVERGYSVIHAVKNDPNFPEPEIRALFQHRRGSPPLTTSTARVAKETEGDP